MSPASPLSATSNTASLMPSSTARRRDPRLPFDHGEPIWRCRYDVIAGVLFAVVAFLIWVDWPVRTHALTVSIVPPGWPESFVYERPKSEFTSVVSLTEDGAISFNGVLVSSEELREQLHSGLNQPVEPEIIFAPDANASYEVSLQVIAVIRRTGVSKFCFGELENHRNFGKGESLPRLMTTIVTPDIDPIAPLADPPFCSGYLPIYD